MWLWVGVEWGTNSFIPQQQHAFAPSLQRLNSLPSQTVIPGWLDVVLVWYWGVRRSISASTDHLNN